MGGGGEMTVRYAPYLEKTHRMLTGVDVVPPVFTMNQALNQAFFNSPYATGNVFERITPERGFFGNIAGEPSQFYRIEDFPSLWDMFGKFMGGLDLHMLWGDVYEDVVHGPEVANSIAAHSALLRDEIDSRVLPQFLIGMRDINAVQATTFVIGKSIIYDAHVKSVNEFAGNLRIASLDLSYKIWFKHLDWSASVVGVYNELFKSYYSTKFDNDARQLEYESKHRLWDLGLFEYARAFTGALNGAAATVGRNEPSQLQKSLGGVLSGAAAGASIGGPYGAAAGAVLGLAGSFM
jgi:hypothetical protein